MASGMLVCRMEVILPPRKDDSVREAPGSASPTLVSPATDTISSGTGGTGHGYNTSDNRSRCDTDPARLP